MGVLGREDRDFPQAIKNICPEIGKLWWKGSWENEMFERCVAIVGSRRMSEYGRQVIRTIVPRLVRAGVTIISGFMYGADQEVHRCCLDKGGKTIAVLAWGIDKKVSSLDERLYQQILDSEGLFLSEHEGETGALPAYFVLRNRIVTALSQAVIVVEGAVGSGSMTTANWALKQGKLLYAVPGSINTKVNEGTNRLIKEGKARMLLNVEEVIDEMGWGSRVPLFPLRELDQERIALVMGRGKWSIDEIVSRTGMAVEEVSQVITLWDIEGKVKEKEGRYKLRERKVDSRGKNQDT